MSRAMRSDYDEECRGLRYWSDDEIRRYYQESERDDLLNERDRLEAERDGTIALASQIESCDIAGEQWDVTDWLLERADQLSNRMGQLEADAEAIEDAMPAERPFIYRVL